LKSELYRTEVSLEKVYPPGTALALPEPDKEELLNSLNSSYEDSALLPLYISVIGLRRSAPVKWQDLRRAIRFQFLPARNQFTTLWLDLIFLLFLDRHADVGAMALYGSAARSTLAGPIVVYRLVASRFFEGRSSPGILAITTARIRLGIWKRVFYRAAKGSDQSSRRKDQVNTTSAPSGSQFPTPPTKLDTHRSHSAMGPGPSFHSSKSSIGFVVPRFGTGFAGGIEALARQAASLLASDYNVHIYTTCATDYLTWSNVFSAGTDSWIENGHEISIHRFEVDHERDLNRFVKIESRLKELLKQNEAVIVAPDHSHTRAPNESVDKSLVSESQKHSYERERNIESITGDWIESQGPISSSLEEQFLTDVQKLDAVVFFTIQYSSTIRLLQKVKDLGKPLAVVPAAHPDWTLDLPTVQENLRLADLWITSTPEEEALLRKTVESTDEEPHAAVHPVAMPGGIPISIPDSNLKQEPIPSLQGKNFLLYVGRLDPSKGVDDLIEYFLTLIGTDLDSDLKLVLVGNSAMAIPDHPSVYCTGYISSEKLEWLYSHARALINPSAYESLSIVLLEAWARGLPTIANGMSDVMVAQTARSGCGYCYRSKEEFLLAVKSLDGLPDVETQGPAFIREFYNEQSIAENYKKAMQFLYFQE